jgi:hypothetical protein
MGLGVGSDGLGRPGRGRAALWGPHLDFLLLLYIQIYREMILASMRRYEKRSSLLNGAGV